MGLDTKTYWLTARQSQCDFDFEELDKAQFGLGSKIMTTVKHDWASSQGLGTIRQTIGHFVTLETVTHIWALSKPRQHVRYLERIVACSTIPAIFFWTKASPNEISKRLHYTPEMLFLLQHAHLFSFSKSLLRFFYVQYVTSQIVTNFFDGVFRLYKHGCTCCRLHVKKISIQNETLVSLFIKLS
jgi:hypothetical protein